MTTKERLHQLVDQLPESETGSAERFLTELATGSGAMPGSEQLRHLQALWDRLTETPAAVPVSESHLALAEERLAAYRRDPAQTHPATDVLDSAAR